MKRRIFFRGIVWLGVTLVVLIAAELAATALLGLARLPASKALVARMLDRPVEIDAHYLALPYYSEQSWSAEYWREHRRALRKRYAPFVVWRSPEFSGSTINIDADGVRVTPQTQCVEGAYRVLLFGGSAVWGWGSPDWGTIAAHLQGPLAERSREPVCIVNFGENAYVSTQNLIQLMLELEAGRVPDLVLFYDGVNDVIQGRQSGRAGGHQNEAPIAERFNDTRSPFARWIASLHLVQIVEQVAAQLGGARPATAEPPVDPDRLARELTSSYLGVYDMVEALADRYGFDWRLFWQPHILAGHKPLSVEEQEMIHGLDWVFPVDGYLEQLFRATYAEVAAAARERDRLISLEDLFDEVDAQIWIDTWGHVTPRGNELVAERMIGELD